MTGSTWIVLTVEQLEHARTLDDDENYVVGGRAIDATAPGEGHNVNPAAIGFAVGAAVPLVGMYVVPARMVEDPDCATYAPGLRAHLSTLPWAELEIDAIFAPAVG